MNNTSSLYLKRMSNSLKKSSKSLIPGLVKNCDRIVDIGCADGSLLNEIRRVSTKNNTLCGVDNNPAMIEKALNNTAFGTCFFGGTIEDMAQKVKEGVPPVDCVIFSSVLHEISSYAPEGKRYTAEPILEALRAANTCLKENGLLIIRDGIAFPSVDYTCRVEFVDPDDIKYFYSFLSENHVADYYSKRDKKIIQGLTYRAFEAPPALALEFLRTYTWGEKSWSREVKEVNGIMILTDWLYYIEKAGFEIESYRTFSEEYPKFLKNKVVCDIPLEKLFISANGLFVAHKKG